MPQSTPTTAELAARLTALEERVSELEHGATTENIIDAAAAGTVHFSGEVALPAGDIKYQWVRPVDLLIETAWEDSFSRISALAHPLRAQILRHLLRQAASVAELVSAEVVSSAGTAYHHISALETAGWVVKQRGVYSIPPARIVPLLCLIACGENH